MRGLPVLIFAAGMAIWGMASIPDGSGAGRASPANRLGEAAWTPHRAFAAPPGKFRFRVCMRRRLSLVAPQPEVASLFASRSAEDPDHDPICPSEVDDDVAGRMRIVDEQIAGRRQVERLGVVSDLSRGKTALAIVADAGPARPAHRHVACRPPWAGCPRTGRCRSGSDRRHRRCRRAGYRP